MKVTRSSLIRLGLGVALIAASVVGVTALVSSLNKSRGMVLAREAMAVGHVISSADLATTDGYVVGSERTFATSGESLIGMVTTRPVARGEVMSDAVVAEAMTLDLTTLVVTVSQGVPAALVAGDTVEVWSSGGQDAMMAPQTLFAEPRPLAVGEFVARAGDPQTLSAGGQQAIEILVAKSDVAALLRAQSSGEGLVVLPARGIAP
jgi:hypothetical protein